MAGNMNITEAMIKYLLDQGHLVWNLDQKTAHHAFEELDDDSTNGHVVRLYIEGFGRFRLFRDNFGLNSLFCSIRVRLTGYLGISFVIGLLSEMNLGWKRSGML